MIWLDVIWLTLVFGLAPSEWICEWFDERTQDEW